MPDSAAQRTPDRVGSSLAYDRGRKARLYAECGVPEYWMMTASASATVRIGPVAAPLVEALLHERALNGGALQRDDDQVESAAGGDVGRTDAFVGDL